MPGHRETLLLRRLAAALRSGKPRQALAAAVMLRGTRLPPDRFLPAARRAARCLAAGDHGGAMAAALHILLNDPATERELLMLLGHDDILKADDLPTEIVDVPEWGGEVKIRCLTGEERDEWEASQMVLRGDQYVRDSANLRAKLVAASIVGEDGEKLFTRQDVYALGRKSGAALDRVFEAATKLSRLTAEDSADLGKDSVNGQAAGSTSISRPASAAPSASSSPGSDPTN